MSTVTKQKLDGNDLSNDSNSAPQFALLREQFSDLSEGVKNTVGQTSEKALATAVSAGSTIQDHTDTVRLKAMFAKDDAIDLIRTRPLLALGVATGLGVLAGAVIGRKSN